MLTTDVRSKLPESECMNLTTDYIEAIAARDRLAVHCDDLQWRLNNAMAEIVYLQATGGDSDAGREPSIWWMICAALGYGAVCFAWGLAL